MQVSLVLAVAWLAARAWAHPAVFLAFGSVTTAFILVPWSLFSKSLHGMSFFDELINLILLLATVIGIGLLCRLIAQGHIQRSGH